MHIVTSLQDGLQWTSSLSAGPKVVSYWQPELVSWYSGPCGDFPHWIRAEFVTVEVSVSEFTRQVIEDIAASALVLLVSHSGGSQPPYCEDSQAIL